MEKSNILTVFSLLMFASMSAASYAGPFLFWGMDNLSNMKTPTLQGKN